MLTEAPTIKLENSEFQKESFIVLSSNKYSLQLCVFFCDNKNKLLPLELISSNPIHLTILYLSVYTPSIRLHHCSMNTSYLCVIVYVVPTWNILFNAFKSQSYFKEILRFLHEAFPGYSREHWFLSFYLLEH